MLQDFITRLFENSAVLSVAILLLYVLTRLLRGKTSPRLHAACWLIVAFGLLLPVRPSLFTVKLLESVDIPATVQGVFDRPNIPAYTDNAESKSADEKAFVTLTDAETVDFSDTSSEMIPLESEKEVSEEPFNWLNILT